MPRAYVVGLLNLDTGTVEKAGIFSEPSPTLLALGLPKDIAGSSLRFSTGSTTTEAEIDEAVRRILYVCAQVRA